MASIGIMGGTFNPVHFGHVEIAKAAFSQYALDEIWFMPNHIPGYKSHTDLISGEHRLNMIKLAIEEIPHFKVSRFELDRTGNTYTAETMTLLKQKYPNDKFYFIMGADSLNSFDKWKNPEIILKYATILVAQREEASLKEVQLRIDELNCLFDVNNFFIINCPEIPCSSSMIRDNLKKLHLKRKNLSVETVISKLYLPERVYKYIIKNQLYL